MSVFTFGTEPTRVSSPWLRPADKPDDAITKLEAEPQEGAIEYKLHLLLRPRRPYKPVRTVTPPSSHLFDRDEYTSPLSALPNYLGRLDVSANKCQVAEDLKRTPFYELFSTTNECRRLRLYHLTTQLLWRLKQSMTNRPLGTTESLIPILPTDTDNLAAAVQPGTLWQGLEESRGALYEIGVSDEGTLVGLPEDELEESLLTLRVMAASLGCVIDITRRLCVGECESTAAWGGQFREKVFVAEALVTPARGAGSPGADLVKRTTSAPTKMLHIQASTTVEQLRVTLTGPSDGGKSTLLGTLCMGIVDNGSGRSRTFLLRHRHELASGITTSLSHMLIGYKNNEQGESQIYSFSDRNIDSWEAIHDSSRDGRLVFVSDSAGHLRFRRTIMRGLVGWAPHWTLLCLPANDNMSNPNFTPAFLQDETGSARVEVDQAKAHLELCLRLRAPLVVVLTKLDVATPSSFRSTVKKVVGAVKEAGRTPRLLIKPRVQSNPSRVPAVDDDDIQILISCMKESDNLRDVVPIVCTSAVKGEGTGLLHALLRNLPTAPTPTARDYLGLALNPEQPESVFHINDQFSLPALYGNAVREADEAEQGTVVAGYLRFGHLAVGDEIIVGPFPAGDHLRVMSPEEHLSLCTEDGVSISHPTATGLGRFAIRKPVPASASEGKWYKARIVTIRNLRLPVRLLEPGQVGTIGLIFNVPKDDLSDSIFERLPRPMPKIRRGMILAMPSKHMVEMGLSLQAANGFKGLFDGASSQKLIAGSVVKVYIASVRASARIIRALAKWTYPDGNGMSVEATSDDNEAVFLLKDCNAVDSTARPENVVMKHEVQFELLSRREWLELGSQVVILEGGTQDRSGLNGFVGKVVEILE